MKYAELEPEPEYLDDTPENRAAWAKEAQRVAELEKNAMTIEQALASSRCPAGEKEQANG